VREASTGELLADLAREGVRYVAARGGRGGRGNAALKGTHDRVPNYAEQGEPGEAHELDLELHLVADAGLIGAPNAGKSTLLSVISRAHPKIADYPFTTIEPGLGVVTYHDERFTVADLPGLIEGASVGKGLGLRFLRHAERCATLVVVVDLAGADPVGDLEAVTGEVRAYDAELAQRMRIVVGNKTDLASADVDGASTWAEAHGMHFVAISAAAQTNLEELKELVATEITRSKAELGEPETFQVYRPAVEDRVVVVRDGEAFRVHSERVERLVVQAALDNPRAVRRLQRQLRSLGVESALKREGATEGAEVRIGDVAFEWIPDA
jgi:GTPase